jgi:hypothetical protein
MRSRFPMPTDEPLPDDHPWEEQQITSKEWDRLIAQILMPKAIEVLQKLRDRGNNPTELDEESVDEFVAARTQLGLKYDLIKHAPRSNRADSPNQYYLYRFRRG